jgi:2-iminobutanoate/2-iminopropanoate deaminase
MEKKVIVSQSAPKAVGPYGQLGLDPTTGQLVYGGIKEQTQQVLKNITALLTAAELTLQNVVQVQIFLTDIGDFAQVNEVYKTFFSEPYPARSTFQVAALPLGARVEIQVIAMK